MSSPIIFKDRADAGKRLAELLQEFKNSNAIVLAIPRGGVIVAKEVAAALGLPLDIIVTRKIGAPGNNEYAIGAIDMSGSAVWNEYEKETISPTWIEKKIASEKTEAERRWKTYRPQHNDLDLKNKTAIIVDDGIATGLTARAAVEYAKHAGARQVIISSPVGAADAMGKLKSIADVRVLETPSYFSAVGEWYKDFPQITDREVIESISTQ